MTRENRLVNTVRLLAVIGGIALLALMMQAVSVANAQVATSASTAGFGAAFGYAQTIGNISYTQAGTIGNGIGTAVARAPGYYQHHYDPYHHKHYYTYVPGTHAYSGALSTGNAASFSQALGTPFGSTAFVQTAAFNGLSAAVAGAN
jgi:hypothetical protein